MRRPDEKRKSNLGPARPKKRVKVSTLTDCENKKLDSGSILRLQGRLACLARALQRGYVRKATVQSILETMQDCL